MTGEDFSLRALGDADRQRLSEFAGGFDCSAIYVLNALGSEVEDPAAIGEFVGVESGASAGDPTGGGDRSLRGLLWFGGRGNLVILLPAEVVEALDQPDRLRCGEGSLLGALLNEIRSRRTAWRIALGPMKVLQAIVAEEQNPPMLLREQIYYSIDRSGQARLESCLDHGRVRRAERGDSRKLVDAALDLNEVDLNVPAWRVDRAWLKESVRRRLQDGRTFVIGPAGRPDCKLDLGSDGPHGAVIEGVYTLPSRRGLGLATVLTATVAHLKLRERPRVCLHVARDNAPARAAYERAGLQEAGATGLLLRNT